MSDDYGIAVEQVPVCLLCGSHGESLYERLSDRMFDAPGAWGYLQCPACSLVWLNPRPLPEELLKTYKTYYTHGQQRRFASWRENLFRGLYATLPGFDGIGKGWIWRWAGRTLSWIPSWKEHAILDTMCLDGGQKGKLLDVGCGDGEFLSVMRLAGWDVAGVEPDPLAASAAQKRLPRSVIAHSLQDPVFSDASLDVITMSHVIEHVPNPVQMLRECRRVLKPTGKIAMVTPNLASQGHRLFQDSWVPLEPPRHLFLFRSSTLRSCCEQAGLSVENLRTSTRSATWVWAASKAIREKGRFNRKTDFTWRHRLEGARFQVREEKIRRHTADTQAGEELALIARPQNAFAGFPSSDLAAAALAH